MVSAETERPCKGQDFEEERKQCGFVEGGDWLGGQTSTKPGGDVSKAEEGVKLGANKLPNKLEHSSDTCG